MKTFFRSLGRRFLHDLRLLKPSNRVYLLDDEAAGLLRSLAEREQRTEEEVAAELLSYAVRQRSTADESLRLWVTLTPREQEIVALACLGHTNQQIAQYLTISQQTVKSHLHRAAKKFGRESKAQLLHALRELDFSAWEPPAGE